METEHEILKKNERKLFTRQKFFEKYCQQAEEKFEKFSKISKVIRKNETDTKDKDEKINQLYKDNERLKKENDKLYKENESIHKEHGNFKDFYNKIQPILKIEWEEIKNSNLEALEKFNSKKNKEDKKDYNTKSIIVLIDTLNTLINNLQNEKEITGSSGSGKVGNVNITSIIDDIKSYIVMLLRKNESLVLNEYHIINLCCDLNDKMKVREAIFMFPLCFYVFLYDFYLFLTQD